MPARAAPSPVPAIAALFRLAEAAPLLTLPVEVPVAVAVVDTTVEVVVLVVVGMAEVGAEAKRLVAGDTEGSGVERVAVPVGMGSGLFLGSSSGNVSIGTHFPLSQRYPVRQMRLQNCGSGCVFEVEYDKNGGDERKMLYC
jgi:hypothetical protein